MNKCKKYTNMEGAARTYRTRPTGDCQSCAFFDPKNCGAHSYPSDNLQNFNMM